MKRSQGGRGRACVRRTVRAADEDPGVERRRLAVEPVRDAEASAVHAQTPRSGVALLVAATATAVSLVRAPHGLSPRPPPAAGWLVSGHLQLRKLVRGIRSALRAADDDSTPSPSPSPHRRWHACPRTGKVRDATQRFGSACWPASLNLGPRASWLNRACATRRAKRETPACCDQSRNVLAATRAEVSGCFPHTQFGGVWFGNLDLGLRRPATVGKGMRPGRESFFFPRKDGNKGNATLRPPP